MRLLLEALNVLFFVFHIGLIFFNLFGWIHKPWRKWNLASLLITAFSWFVIGMFYGFGYCFLTDWHWQVRERLGYSTDSNSYIHFLITAPTGLPIGEKIVDIFTAVFFFSALTISAFVNIRAWLVK